MEQKDCSEIINHSYICQIMQRVGRKTKKIELIESTDDHISLKFRETIFDVFGLNYFCLCT